MREVSTEVGYQLTRSTVSMAVQYDWNRPATVGAARVRRRGRGPWGRIYRGSESLVSAVRRVSDRFSNRLSESVYPPDTLHTLLNKICLTTLVIVLIDNSERWRDERISKPPVHNIKVDFRCLGERMYRNKNNRPTNLEWWVKSPAAGSRKSQWNTTGGLALAWQP